MFNLRAAFVVGVVMAALLTPTGGVAADEPGCVINGSTLVWDDAGVAEYHVRHNGSWVADTTDLSYAVDDVGGSWVIRHREAGEVTDWACAPDAGGGDAESGTIEGVCQINEAVLMWSDAGASEYHVRGDGSWVASTTDQAYVVDDPDADWVIRHWVGGEAIDWMCRDQIAPAGADVPAPPDPLLFHAGLGAPAPELPDPEFCDGYEVTIDADSPGVTTDGSTTIFTGTSGVDVILGTDGVDIIDAGSGDDVICAGSGDDIITAGPGHDRVFGEMGDDTIHGGNNNDYLHGGGGHDKLNGGRGNDELRGRIGTDELIGGRGNDLLLGHNGTDTYNPGSGSDQCDDPDAATNFGGCEQHTGVVVQEHVGPTTPAAGVAKCQGLTATIVGTPSPDGSTVVIVGTPSTDVIFGTPGVDLIRGYGGDDVICGMGGDDTIYGGDGNDDLYGEAGDDTIFGEGDDDDLYGGDGDDRLWGSSGNDTIVGGVGGDRMYGGSGEDRLFGNTGSDSYDPGSGSADRCEDDGQILSPSACDLVTGQGDNVVFLAVECGAIGESGVVTAKVLNDGAGTREYELRVDGVRGPGLFSDRLIAAGTAAWLTTGLSDGLRQISVVRLEPVAAGQPTGQATVIDSRSVTVDCDQPDPAPPDPDPDPDPGEPLPYCNGSADIVVGLDCGDFRTKVWVEQAGQDLTFAVWGESHNPGLRYEVYVTAWACGPDTPPCQVAYVQDPFTNSVRLAVVGGETILQQSASCVRPPRSALSNMYQCELEGPSMSFPQYSDELCGALAEVKIFDDDTGRLLYAGVQLSHSVLCNPF